MNATTEILCYDIVEIADAKHEKNKKYVGLSAVDTTPDYVFDGNAANETVLRLVNASEDCVSFAENDIEVKIIGYFEVDKRIPWPMVENLISRSHRFVAENTKNEILVETSVSCISDLRVIQMTERFLMGYRVARADDAFNLETPSRLNAPMGYVYFFVKTGQIKNVPIYRYASDMVVSDQNEAISWVLGFGSFETDNDPRITRVDQTCK